MRLAPGVRFAGSSGHEAMPVLVCPDGKVQLNANAATILRLCDGSRTRDELIAEVMRRVPSRAVEIVEFLNAAHGRGWIVGV